MAGVLQLRGKKKSPGARLDPEVRSWIRNVIVPAMVREYLAEHGGAIVVAEPIATIKSASVASSPREMVGKFSMRIFMATKRSAGLRMIALA